MLYIQSVIKIFHIYNEQWKRNFVDSTLTKRRVLACSIMFLTFLFAAGCHLEGKERRSSKLIERAVKYREEGKLQEARITLRQALDLKPDAANAYYELAEVFIRLKNFAEAKANYTQAINLDSTHHDARLHLATWLFLAKNYDEAEQQLRVLLQTNPDDIAAASLSATIEHSRGQSSTAKELFERLIQANPKQALPYANLANIFIDEGQLQQAEKLLKQALQNDPKNIPVRFALSQVALRQGRDDEALQILQDLVTETPRNAGLHHALGELFLLRGAQDKASLQFEETLKSEPLRHEVRDRLYDIYLLHHQKEKAQGLTTTLVSLAPQDPAAFYFQGRDAEVQEDFKKAGELYEKGIGGLPKFSAIFRHLGLLELRLGERVQALEHLNQAVAINAGDSEARLTLARDAFRQKDVNLATEHLKKVLALAPHHLEANVLLADIELVRAKVDFSRQVYDLLIKAFPENAVGYFKLGLLEEKAENKEGAITAYRECLKRDQFVAGTLMRFVPLLREHKDIEEVTKEIEEWKTKSEHSKPEYDVILAALILQKKNLEEKDLTEARELLDEALTLRPDFLFAYYALVRLEGRAGRTDQAIAHTEKLIQLQPRQVPPRFLQALLYEKKGEFEKATQKYREILTLAPRFALAANNLAYLLAERVSGGDLDEALKLAQVAKTELPRESGVADTLAWVYFRRGQPRAALPLVEEALEIERQAGEKQQNPEFLYHLGMIKKALHDTDGAKQAFFEVLKGDSIDQSLQEKVQKELVS